MKSTTARLEIRLPADVKTLAEEAALMSGYRLEDYLVELVRSDALQRLAARSGIQLGGERFDRFIEACETARAPSKAISDAAYRLDKTGF